MDGQLVLFRTQNHRSLRDQQELSFVSSGGDDAWLLRPAGIEDALLPVAAIYGANASGKSNVLNALEFARNAVVFSQSQWHPDEGIARRQFFEFENQRNKPSLYVFQIMLGGVRYEYGFAVDSMRVVEEWLCAWPQGRRQEWFSRDGQKFQFGRAIEGEKKAIETLTRTNSLFLSAAAQNNHAQLTPIFQWFSMRLRCEGPPTAERSRYGASFHDSFWSPLTDDHIQNESSSRRREQIRSLLASADLGIYDFSVDERPIPQVGRSEFGPRVHRRFSFSHKAGDNTDGAWLELAQESTGTKGLLNLLPALFQVLERGGLVTIDELNALHPMLALAVVRLFQDPKRNVHGAQLLFNTHEPSLLGTMLSDPPPLRRDQVWLTEKDPNGSTRLYPITDYKPRPAENLERGYLQGRYGGVPFVETLDWPKQSKRDGD